MEQFETILRGIKAAAPFDRGRAEGIFSTATLGALATAGKR